MKILLERIYQPAGFTLGRLSIDGEFHCLTLEDEVRAGPKVDSKTAIPAGEYEIQVTYSPRFGKNLPILLGVPNFTGIRIHTGNYSKNTEGCILPGVKWFGEDYISDSKMAFDPLFALIKAAINRKEKVIIKITNP